MNGLPSVGLRYFNVYGPRMDVTGAYTEVFIRWMEQIAGGRPPVIFGDGSQTMDFVYVDDVARANLLAARAPVTDRAYNIATGTETSLSELAALLLRTMGAKLDVEYASPRKVNPVSRRIADTWRAQQEIGFQAVVPFDQGLKKLVGWWQQERAAVQV
jgi:UDP-glucose 4-epimerase